MKFLLLVLFLSASLALLVFGTGQLISLKTFWSREKSTPFECGFDPLANARIPFSLRFFLLAVIFLVFDIEVALLFPYPLTVWGGQGDLLNLSFFMLILVVGLLHEWNEGSLKWSD